MRERRIALTASRPAPLAAADLDLDELADRAALVTRDSTWRFGAQVALELHRNPREVQYWGEPQDHRPGPLYKMACFLRALLRAQKDRSRALLPLHWLCEEAGGRFVTDDVDAAADAGAKINTRLTACIGSFGRVLAQTEASILDGTINDREFDAVRTLIREHRSTLHHAEESLVRAHQEKRRLT